MTREIEFKIWDKHFKKWYEPTYRAYDNDLEYLSIGLDGSLQMNKNGNIMHESTFLDRFVKVQFTGLKDKNGKKIFEGDIVGGSLEDGTVGKSPVFWGYNCYQPFNYLDCRSEDLEVLDNIYENPSILTNSNSNA